MKINPYAPLKRIEEKTPPVTPRRTWTEEEIFETVAQLSLIHI